VNRVSLQDRKDRASRVVNEGTYRYMYDRTLSLDFEHTCDDQAEQLSYVCD